MKHAAPIIAAMLLLLLMYVGSYFAMVVPRGYGIYRCQPDIAYYRFGWQVDDAASKIFWPLEQIDRKIRPEAWEPLFEAITSHDRRTDPP
jgi:hypothetical protein